MIVNYTGFHILKEEETVWKKLRDSHYNEYLAECIIPAGTKCLINCGNSRNSRKCRAEQAIPIAFYEPRFRGNVPRYTTQRISCSTDLVLSKKTTIHHKGLVGRAKPLDYKIGKAAKPSKRFALHSNQCAAGIHFFPSYEDALNF